ncbi:MAG: metallophosphoesterase, partial [Myxococcales bacterium]|nr:metallophosphoesterase [Polyangiaceae bacterium]MDW8251823.1 metallophosphoesterase [Myxococcales bacterium]
PAGPFPFVRLRGEVALVGLASAIPSPPLCAYGRLGAEQRSVFRHLLLAPAISKRFVVTLIHHPPYNPSSPLKTLRNGLHDADELRASFTGPALVLHGHLHKRIVQGDASGVLSCGATSASLVNEHPDQRAGFNLYEIDGHGLRESRAVVLGEGGAFSEHPLPNPVG